MNGLELIKHDHDTVRDLFEQFRSAAESEDSSRMGSLAEEIFHELEVHTAIEEEVLYPAVRDAGGGDLDDLTDESKEEHHVVDVLMEEIRTLSPSDDSFKAKMTVLIENVEHHASEEEDEMFPKIRDLMDESRLDRLGVELEDAKRRHQGDAMSKQELYDEAKVRGVEGRSQMTKEELAEAVRDDSGG